MNEMCYKKVSILQEQLTDQGKSHKDKTEKESEISTRTIDKDRRRTATGGESESGTRTIYRDRKGHEWIRTERESENGTRTIYRDRQGQGG